MIEVTTQVRLVRVENGLQDLDCNWVMISFDRSLGTFDAVKDLLESKHFWEF